MPLYINNFAAFNIGARRQSWCTELAFLYVQHKAFYTGQHAFTCTARSICIQEYRSQRLYTTKAHEGTLVLLLRELVHTIRDEGLEALLNISKFSGTLQSSLVECVVIRAALVIEWDGVKDETEYKHELFCLYD